MGWTSACPKQASTHEVDLGQGITSVHAALRSQPWLHKTLHMPLIDLANPTRFHALAGRVLPWLAAATAVFFAIGLALAWLAPGDYQQGETAKIMFVHV